MLRGISWIFVAFAVFLATNVYCEVDNHEGVVKLTKRTWNQYINGQRNVLVKFSAPWCPHCRHLVGPFQELANSYHDDPNVVIADVDTDSSFDLGRQEGVQYIPMFKFFPKGETWSDFINCGHSFQEMRSYIEKNRKN